MDYTFKAHKLSNAERKWLNEVANATKFDPRVAKVRLFEQLPIDFDPSKIDRRLYYNNKLTLVGLWHVRPTDPIFEVFDKVIRAIKREITEGPGIDRLAAVDIAKVSGVATRDVARALKELEEVGYFFSGASGSGDELESVWLTSLESYDAYLRYKNMDDVLEQYYVSHRPSSKPFQQFVSFGAGQTREGLVLEQESIKPNTAFVLMAIDRNKPELEDVYNTIKDVCKQFGIVAYRADEIEHADRITDQILTEIRTCEYLIADLSYERPNVYYEVGYAHAVNKKPILYRRTDTRLHFDLSVHNVPEYRNVTELRELLTRRLEAILGRQAKST